MNKGHCHICPWWKAYTFDNSLRYLITPPQKVLKPYLKEGMTFLDLGCGMGFFSINAAKLVKESGTVISVDVQPKMLEILKKRAQKSKTNEIIKTHLAQSNNINLEIKADFALAMWMLHETPDLKSFLEQVKAILKPNSYFLIAEPSHHISNEIITKEIETATQLGFKFIEHKDVGLFSKGFLLQS